MNETENQRLMQFSFCVGCGSYLAPDAGTVIEKAGVKRLLCLDCQSKLRPDIPDDTAITTADEFVERYKLNET